MESLVSREATFLFNNLLLVGIAFAVLWGVLFPLISETVGDERLNVTTRSSSSSPWRSGCRWCC